MTALPILATIEATPQLSVAAGKPRFTVVVQSPVPFALVLAVLSPGHMIVGGVISFNVIVKVVVAVFPLPSLAVIVINRVVL